MFKKINKKLFKIDNNKFNVPVVVHIPKVIRLDILNQKNIMIKKK
jgi:hypothetical protein